RQQGQRVRDRARRQGPAPALAPRAGDARDPADLQVHRADGPLLRRLRALAEPGVRMATIFDKILDGELPCHRVYEDGQVLAFLDIGPLSRGHTLVIPK